MRALKDAVEKNDQMMKDSSLSLVRGVQIMLENEYAGKDRREANDNDA